MKNLDYGKLGVESIIKIMMQNVCQLFPIVAAEIAGHSHKNSQMK